MKLKDLIDLAKAGYTPAEVKELLALGDESASTPTEAETKSDVDINTSSTATESFDKSPLSTVENSGDLTPTESPVDTTAKDAEIEKLKNEIAALKKSNLNKDLSESTNTMTDEDRLNDLILNFL